MADIQYRPRKRHDWCVGALHCFSAILSFQRCFLVRKLYKETETHKLTLKIGATQVFSEFTDIYWSIQDFDRMSEHTAGLSEYPEDPDNSGLLDNLSKTGQIDCGNR